MSQLYKLYKLLRKWKFYYLLAAILLVLSTVFRMLEPKILQVAIDGVLAYFQKEEAQIPESNDPIASTIYQILPDLSTNSIGTVLICLGLLYIAIAAIRGATMFGSNTINAFSTEKAIKRLRDNLFSHLQHLPLNFYAKNTTGDLIQRCTGDVDTIRNFISSQLVDVVLLSSMFISAFTMMAMVHVQYALIAVSLSPIIIISAYLFFRKEKEIWKKHEAEQDKLTSITEENLGGIRVVKAFAKEDFEIARFQKQNEATRQIGIKHVGLHAIFWTLSDLLVWVQFALTLFAGGYFALTKQISVGELVSFYTYAFAVTMPMRRLAQVISKMGMAMVAVDRLSSILDQKEEDYDGIHNKNQLLKGDIEFRNVWFKYKEDDPYTLKDVSFKVNAGETIALMGPTGSGKSTIIALLSRFFEPEKGEILLDSIPLNQYSKTYLRKRLGVVLQKSFLFSTTIRNNIAYTNPQIDESLIIEAAKSASIHEIIDVFPEGYDTVVGEKGVTLSGGQKQRITLARTLLENPEILVLDDSTSAIDTETEIHIQEALRTHMEHKTTFIIAHRISAVQHADKIFILMDGSIVDQGDHDSLLTKDGFYKEVYEVQTNAFD